MVVSDKGVWTISITGMEELDVAPNLLSGTEVPEGAVLFPLPSTERLPCDGQASKLVAVIERLA